MGFLDRMLDWAADKVQTVTGEKERRQLIAELKEQYSAFVEEVGKAISALNRGIRVFNDKIHELNALRQGIVYRNITGLSVFLRKFGHVKEVGAYAGEQEKQVQALPDKKFERIENFISDVDWSSDDVFLNTFFLSPFGMKLKTRMQNLSMREKLHEFTLEAEHTLKQLELRKFAVKRDRRICAIYIDCVRYVSQYIEETILPELELVEAFFQALKIKDEVLAGHSLQDLVFQNNIEVLRDTPYEKHYLFVRNTFLFYVLSCKIYNTPVLTRLLNSHTTAEDLQTIENQKEALLLQGEQVREQLLIESGKVAI